LETIASNCSEHKLIAVIGHAVAVTAAVLGITAWSVLALGLAYSRLFVSKERKDPKAVMSPRVATQVFIVTTATCISAASLVVAIAGLLIGESTHWAWIGAGASAALFASFGGAVAVARYRDLARQK
jgi:hypothetical protein